MPAFERLLASRTLRWYGHLHRMSTSRMTHTVFRFKILYSPPEGVARPKRRNMIDWDSSRKHAISTTVEHFPALRVPSYKTAINDRKTWRRWSAAYDLTHNWKVAFAQQRLEFIDKMCGLGVVAGLYAPTMGLRAYPPLPYGGVDQV